METLKVKIKVPREENWITREIQYGILAKEENGKEPGGIILSPLTYFKLCHELYSELKYTSDSMENSYHGLPILLHEVDGDFISVCVKP